MTRTALSLLIMLSLLGGANAEMTDPAAGDDAAMAQTPEFPADEDWSEEDEDTSLDFSGRVKVESAIGVNRGRGQKLEMLFEPQVEFIAGDLTLTAIARALVDPLDELDPGKPGQSSVSQYTRRWLIGDSGELDLRELYVETSLGETLLTVGKQQIVWGQADGLKVLDIVNPQYFREFILAPFSDSRIPLWALNVEVPIDPFVVQVVWIPDQTYHVLPEPDGDFAFTSPRLIPTPPPGIPVVVDEPDRPRRVVSDSDAGVRVSTFWLGWDVTFNYLYHYDDIPVFSRTVIFPGGGPTVVVTPEYRRAHMVGSTASKAFGNVTVRGEFAAFLDKRFTTNSVADADGIVKSDEISYVIGLDWFGIDETLISAQIFQSTITEDQPGVLRDRTETSVTLLVRHEMLNDRLMVEALWLHGVEHGDGLLRPKVQYEVDDHTTVWIGYDFFYGGGSGLFGQFDSNDRFLLGLEWGF
ncbi:MAG: hypothetical protein CMJ18_27175 [Phycisphaeraceae bacterium]|nr:hypothetical protein [Phycisphaeraceae bacterium]